MTVAFDVDDVLCDMVPEWLRMYNEKSGDDLKPEDITAWDMSKFVSFGWEKDIYTFVESPTLYLHAKPVPGMQAVVNFLRDQGHKIVFVTSAHPNVIAAQKQWLRRHGFLSLEQTHITTKGKHHVAADILIDDNISHVLRFKETGRPALCYPRPWNTPSLYPSVTYYPAQASVAVQVRGILEATKKATESKNTPLISWPKVEEATKAVERYYEAYGKTFNLCAPLNLKVESGKPSPGYKLDEGKDMWDLLPTDGVRQIVKVLTLGAAKYEPYNWAKGMVWSRVYSALQRHLTAWWEREDKDPETGLSHLAHAGCCLLFLLTYVVRGMVKWDDRPKSTS